MRRNSPAPKPELSRDRGAFARDRDHVPNSRLLARGVCDGRSRNGRFIAAAKAELTKHLGGNLSATQRVLVDRTCWLMLHCALFDERVADSGKPLTDHDRRSYLAFSNSLTRTLARLGLEPAPAPQPSLSEYLAAKSRHAVEAAD